MRFLFRPRFPRTTGAPTWAIPAMGILLVAFFVWIVAVWWQRRRLESGTRDRAMEGCVARLGDEAACRDHLAAYAEDCFHMNFFTGTRSRGVPEHVDDAGYLDCVVLGADDWLAQRKSRNDAAARERAVDLRPPR